MKFQFFLTGNDSVSCDYNFIAAYNALDFIKPEIDSFNKLKGYYKKHNDWFFGHFSYDLKNEIEDLKSNNKDRINFPSLFFFRPEIVFHYKNNELSIESYKSKKYHEKLLVDINKIELKKHHKENIEKIDFQSIINKDAYKKNVSKIKKQIQYGNIYEMNYCREFFAKAKEINPILIYNKLSEISPTPFSAFYKINNKYLISASPERFIKKSANKIISQPIKGTIKRGKNKEEDKILKKQLADNPKEVSENVMIVDLVRNDLSRTAKKGSVKVKELFGIYTFPQVHQMISTIESEKNDKYDNIDVIKNAFPMGSMTGAPKIKAMELIEKYELTKRGIYSGAIGYFDPNGNFDFNVVIRSLSCNTENKNLSFIVGGAITIESIPEKEYEECMLKAKAIMDLFNSNTETKNTKP